MISRGFEPRTHQVEGRCHKEEMKIEGSESVTKCNQLKILENFANNSQNEPDNIKISKKKLIL